MAVEAPVETQPVGQSTTPTASTQPTAEAGAAGAEAPTTAEGTAPPVEAPYEGLDAELGIALQAAFGEDADDYVEGIKLVEALKQSGELLGVIPNAAELADAIGTQVWVQNLSADLASADTAGRAVENLLTVTDEDGSQRVTQEGRNLLHGVADILDRLPDGFAEPIYKKVMTDYLGNRRAAASDLVKQYERAQQAGPVPTDLHERVWLAVHQVESLEEMILGKSTPIEDVYEGRFLPTKVEPTAREKQLLEERNQNQTQRMQQALGTAQNAFVEDALPDLNVFVEKLGALPPAAAKDAGIKLWAQVQKTVKASPHYDQVQLNLQKAIKANDTDAFVAVRNKMKAINRNAMRTVFPEFAKGYTAQVVAAANAKVGTAKAATKAAVKGTSTPPTSGTGEQEPQRRPGETYKEFQQRKTDWLFATAGLTA
jgi:hypothetical protein